MSRINKTLAATAGTGMAGYAAYVATTFMRYGHPHAPTRTQVDALLDRFMPTYDVVERDSAYVSAPADVTFAAAKEIDFDSSPIVRAIFRAREILLRSARSAAPMPKGILAKTRSLGWGVLAEVADREVVMGAVTKPWEPNPQFRSLPPEDFEAFAEPGYVKIAWTLRVDPQDDGGSIFRTETRAIATDNTSRKRFRLYWSLLSPGIMLIRSAMVPSLRRAADRKWQLEGDDIIADAGGQLTHAITIAAPPEDVWPWLLQMGCQRAGWYSWDFLDNGRKPSADRIIPELQHLEVGDVLPARPVGKDGFNVRRILPERALILGSLTPDWQGTWAFVLERLPGNRTRLIARYRAALASGAKMALLLPLYATVHAFMERKQLRTIKHHAEHLHAHRAPSACGH